MFSFLFGKRIVGYIHQTMTLNIGTSHRDIVKPVDATIVLYESTLLKKRSYKLKAYPNSQVSYYGIDAYDMKDCAERFRSQKLDMWVMTGDISYAEGLTGYEKA